MTEKLIFRKEEFDKFDREKGIKQNYTELWNVGNDFVKLVSIILGDIDISYDF